jgi:hypothetical protein
MRDTDGEAERRTMLSYIVFYAEDMKHIHLTHIYHYTYISSYLFLMIYIYVYSYGSYCVDIVDIHIRHTYAYVAIRNVYVVNMLRNEDMLCIHILIYTYVCLSVCLSVCR